MKAVSLEDQLRRSIHQVRAKKVRMTEQSQSITIHRDVSGPLEFSDEQVQLLRDGYAPGASPIEFRMLLEVARLRRLNPFLKQIHFVKRRSKDRNDNWVETWTSQVSIDGLRAIAERTGKYDGQDEPEYERDKDGLILAAKVRVYRKDWSRPAVGVARWSEYVQTTHAGKPTKFWDTMPHVMIAKCAEALALRKAFPEDLAGIYTDEEMEQADNTRQIDNGSNGALSAHVAPGQSADDLPTDGGASGNQMLSKLVELEAAVDAIDSYVLTLRARELLGGKGHPAVITKGLSEKIQTGEISPAQQTAIGKIAQRLNRRLEKLEAKFPPPPVESSFIDEPDGTEALAPLREPGADEDEPI